ncbi:unnamed protein product [marine sediment metagenome]|uniref:Uncharacterized protein n=1 Tax=marine sediment metagenome TaxID=412755 RepID=X0S5D9_9ZZZZ
MEIKDNKGKVIDRLLSITKEGEKALEELGYPKINDEKKTLSDEIKRYDRLEANDVFLLNFLTVKEHLKEYVDWVELKTNLIINNPQYREKAKEIFGERLM